MTSAPAIVIAASARFRLREVREEDWTFLLAFCMTAEEIGRTPPLRDEEGCRRWASHHAAGRFQKPRREYRFVIESYDGSELGWCDLYAVEQGRANLGYWIDARYWNRGYATEAGRLMLGWAFSHLPLTEARATTQAGNEASRRVLEKCGFQFQGINDSGLLRYRLLREEWQALSTPNVPL